MAWVRVRDRETGKERVVSEGIARTLKDRFELIADNVEQKDEVVESESLQAPKVSVPNAVAASVEVAADEPKNDELETARKRYEQLYGGKPHGRTRLETLLKLIAEKENAN